MQTEKDLRAIEKIEHQDVRWLSCVYDTVFYVLSWILLFAACLLFGDGISFTSAAVHFGVGYVLFFGFRFIFKVYKSVIRFGTLRSFSRDFAATVIGGILFVAASFVIGIFFETLSISTLVLTAFSAIYVIVSMAIRIIYCYLYRAARADTAALRVSKASRRRAKAGA